MRSRFLHAPLAFWLCGMLATEAWAAPIAIQPHLPALTGEFSNLGPSHQQAADDFVLSAASTLESLTWFGRYFANIAVANPIDFSIRIFADSGGAPAVVPFHVIAVSVNAVATGDNFGGVPWFSYSTPLAIALGPGTYWLSILENDASTPLFGGSQWLWGDSAAGLRALRLSDGSAWISGLDNNHAFTLNGTPVPEPSTLVLSAVGLAALARRVRARVRPRRPAGLR